MDPVQKIGWLLRWQRKQRKLTVKMLAERAQINASTVNRIETGQGAGLGTIMRVARELGLEDRIVNAFAVSEDAPEGQSGPHPSRN